MKKIKALLRKYTVRNFSNKLGFIYISLIAVLIITVSVVTYIIALDNVSSVMDSYVTTILNQIRINIDSQLKTIDNSIIYKFSNNKDIKLFMNDSYNSISEEQSSKSRLQDILVELKESYEYIDSIYVYSQETHDILTETVQLTSEDHYDMEWKERSEGKPVVWFGIRTIGESVYHPYFAEVITYVRKHPFTNNFKKNDGRIVVNVKTAILDQVMEEQDSFNNGGAVVFDEYGNLILSSGNELSADEYNKLFDTIGKQEGPTYSIDLAGEKFRAAYQYSDELKWNYFYIIPQKKVYLSVIQMRVVFFVITWVLLMLAILGNIWIKKHALNPVDKFVRRVADATRKENSENVVTLNEAEKLFDEMYSEHKDLIKRLEKHAEVLKWRVLTDIVFGYKKDAEEISNQINTLGINIKYYNYTVIILKAAGTLRLSAEQSAKIKRFIDNEIVDDVSAEVFELPDGNLCAILSFDESNILKCGAMAILCAQNISDYAKKENIMINIGVGRSKKTLDHICESYNEAVSALSYSMIINDCHVISVDEIVDYDEKRIFGILSDINEISQSLRSGIRIDYHKRVSLITEKYKKERLAPKLILQLTVQLIMQSVYVVVDMGIPIEKLLGENYTDIYSLLEKFESVDELNDYVGDILECFSESIKQKRNTKNSNEQTMEKIMEFIHENYNLPNLSLNMLSQEFHFSAPYLSKMFKQMTETNFLDYLISLRIEKAKELLKENDYSNSEIAQKVGYTTYHSFMQIFKKYTGMTPSEFRNQNTKEDKDK